MEQLDDLQTPVGETDQPTGTSAPALFDDEHEDLETGAEGEGNQEAGGAAPEALEVEDPAAQPAESRTFRKLREISNAALKDKRRLERELEEIRAKLPKPEPTLGAKPTLDQYDYDETKFSEAYDLWMEQKAAMDAADRQKLDAQRKQQEELDAFKESYAARSKALGVDDFQEAEAEVGTMLNQTQSGLLMRGADDPAALVYALSKSPARLIELSKIADPVKFTVAVAKLEIALSAKRPSRPAPEARVSSERSATGHSATSNALEKLRDEAARNGDYSKVVAYKKQNGIK
jgi:hypothetical protein